MKKVVCAIIVMLSGAFLSGCGIKGHLETYEDVENQTYDK